MRLNEKGFSVFELFLILIAIAILAAFVIIPHKVIQEKNRDTERKSDIVKIQAQLEAYNAAAGVYPTLADLNNADWLKANMKQLDQSVLKDPLSGSAKISATPHKGMYAYSPSPAGCDNGENGGNGGNCTGYTLTALLESPAGSYVKKSTF